MPAKTALHVIAKKPGSLGNKEKHREERKRILKMCVTKLRAMEDPETVLCRAVLINNTFKTLKYAQRYRMPLKKSQLKRHAVEDSVVDESESSETEARQGRKVERVEEETQPQTYESTEDTVPEDTPYIHRSEVSDLDFQNNRNNDINEINCDITDTYNAESIVHSLVMPPLLSPHLEDMTNCSFYENFTQETPSILVDDQAPDSSHTNLSQNESKQRYSGKSDMLSGSLKLTMLKTDLCDVISESNSNAYPESTFDFSSKVELSGCSGVSGDIGNSLMIDNLLTEIVQV